MRRIGTKSALRLVPAVLWLCACAQQGTAVKHTPVAPTTSQSPAESSQVDEPAPPAPKADPMADEPGDKPSSALQGANERIDCTNGTADSQARMAFDARGGQVTYFAYYSKIGRRTCSLEFARNAPGTKWRVMTDGATRVQTPDGRFVIRTRTDAYVFEFQGVSRQKFCSVAGEINGTMTIKRGAGKPECSVSGVLSTN